MEHLDVLIVGAGLSGVGAAVHLKKNCPKRTFAVLEGRERMGGTWDLFRYPGIRSDSDMYTLGYSFQPWKEAKAIADGPSILRYVNATAQEYGIDEKIRYQHRVTRATWSSEDARWTVSVETGPDRDVMHMTCAFLYLCTGYYNYDEGYTPTFEGTDRFRGRLIHPQHWPEDLDYTGKRVVVIGSGATAVTLVPAMAETAGHVTMLQRSPTYVLSRPEEDQIAALLRRTLPAQAAYGVSRWKNVLLFMLFFQLSRRRPRFVKNLLQKHLRTELGQDFDVDTHFKPTYDPWDQRLCVVPNGDLFQALRQGRASVVTEHIDTFTEKGIRLQSGRELDADIIVTATGLQLLPLGGMDIVVDGRPIELGKTLTYKGMMLSDVPNLAYTVGYTNASWTLKADLTAEYVCRLLNFMARKGYRYCMPRNTDSTVAEQPIIDLASGYVLRALDKLPKQGSKYPWKLYQNYVLDLMSLRHGPVRDPSMLFSKGEADSKKALP